MLRPQIEIGATHVVDANLQCGRSFTGNMHSHRQAVPMFAQLRVQVARSSDSRLLSNAAEEVVCHLAVTVSPRRMAGERRKQDKPIQKTFLAQGAKNRKVARRDSAVGAVSNC